jgi:hypothetical protein
MNGITENRWMLAALVGLTLLASSAAQSRAGTIPPGTYTTTPGFVNTKSLTVTDNNTASGTGAFKTLAATPISFTVAAQTTGTSTTYAFSETLQNFSGPGPKGELWTDFEMTLGGSVGATFDVTSKPFSDKFSMAPLSNGDTKITFEGGFVPEGTFVTFAYSIDVPNPKPNVSPVLILTEQATVPEPSTLVMSGIGMIGLVCYVLCRRRPA